nr:phage terminase large subunit [Campylobacter sp.]
MDINILKPFEPLFRGSLSDKRLIIFYGGRGGGKTDQITLFLLYKALTEKNITILVGREFEKANINSLVSNFKRWIYALNLDNVFLEQNVKLLKITTQKIICNATNTDILFLGINHNSIMSIKSIPNIKYAWIEEANYLKEQTYRILTPTIIYQKSFIAQTSIK